MGSEARGTDVLTELRSGRREVLDTLIVTLYDELRDIAHRHRMRRGDSATLVTTALVHEAYLKLVDQSRARWNDRAHFLALAAVAMRHILIDRAKASAATKRGSSFVAVTLEDDVMTIDDRPGALLQLNDALDQLAEIDPRLASVVEYRFFGGLTNEEIAEALGIGLRTVERDWGKARLLLRRLLAA